MKQPKCVQNPRTGEPFSRHLWGHISTSVATYVRGSYGEMRPYSYSYKRTCKRCGYTDRWS